MSLLKIVQPPNPDTRPVIIEATEFILEQYSDPTITHTHLDVPMRVGKSSIIRNVAVEAKFNPTIAAPFSVVFSPGVVLANQIIGNHEVMEWNKRYRPRVNDLQGQRVDLVSASFFERSNTFLYSMTTQWASSDRVGTTRPRESNLSTIRAAINHARLSQQGRPICFFDEAQVLGDGTDVETMWNEFIASGAFCVGLTGTFFRSGWVPIAGAKCTGKIFYPRGSNIPPIDLLKTPNPVKDRGKDGTSIGNQEADFTMPIAEAWKSKIISRITGIKIDTKLKNGAHKGKLLSEVTPLQQNDYSCFLRTVLEDPDFIKTAVDTFIKDYQFKNSQTRKVRAMIAVGSDYSNDQETAAETNRMALQVKTLLDSQLQKYGTKISIATSNVPDAEGVIKNFKNGTGADILIVKAMGAVGLDMKSLKLLAVLSPLRTGPTLMQLLLRIATMWDESPEVIPTVIVPADHKMANYWKHRIANNGGGSIQFINSSVEKLDILGNPIIDETVDKPVSNTAGCKAIFEETHVTSHTDNDDDERDGDYMNECFVWRFVYPELTQNKTDPEIIDMMKYLPSIVITDEHRKAYQQELDKNNMELSGLATVSVGHEDLKIARDAFTKAARQYADAHRSYAYDKVGWRKAVSYIQAEAKKRVGLGNTTVKQMYARDIPMLNEATKLIKAST